MGSIYKSMATKLKNFERLKQQLPAILGTQAVNFFQDSFRKQGFTDSSFQRWDPRQNGSDSKRATLVKTGALRRDPRVRIATWSRIVISTSLPYASVHNRGGDFTIRAHTRRAHMKNVRHGPEVYSVKTRKRIVKKKKLGMLEQKVKAHKMRMPTRKFMGKSYTLRQMQRKKIQEMLRSI